MKECRRSGNTYDDWMDFCPECGDLLKSTKITQLKRKPRNMKIKLYGAK